MPFGWRWAAFGMVLFGHWLASVRASIFYYGNQIVERYEKIIAIMLNQRNLKWSVLISEPFSSLFWRKFFDYSRNGLKLRKLSNFKYSVVSIKGTGCNK